jgi:uncharacterized protein YndB with AHSA1/START domain
VLAGITIGQRRSAPRVASPRHLIAPEKTGMKWLLIAIGVIVLLVAVVALVGSGLPKGHVARRSALFSQPPDSVWGVITDFAAQPSWRKDVTKVEKVSDGAGGAIWREEAKNGAIPFQTTEAVAPRRLVRTIADPKLPFGGRWIYELETTPDGGTRLSITEQGEVYNPVFRFVSHFFMDQGATMEGYLRALSARFGQPPRIESR